jgi:hypothetical protein
MLKMLAHGGAVSTAEGGFCARNSFFLEMVAGAFL